MIDSSVPSFHRSNPAPLYQLREGLRELGPPAAWWLVTRILGTAIAAAVQLAGVVAIGWLCELLIGR